MFELKIEAFDDMINFLQDKLDKRKTWKEKFNIYVGRELNRVGRAMEIKAKDFSPVLTGKMKSRISYKVPVWNYLYLTVEEDSDDQYALPVHDGFIHYRSGKYVKGQPFLQRAVDLFFPVEITKIIYAHWKLHWHK